MDGWVLNFIDECAFCASDHDRYLDTILEGEETEVYGFPRPVAAH